MNANQGIRREALLEGIVASSVKRSMGQWITDAKGNRYLKALRKIHSSMLIGTGGWAANQPIRFFQNPADVGAPVLNLAGAARQTDEEVKPDNGQVYQLLGFDCFYSAFQDGNLGAAFVGNTTELIDQFLNQPATADIIIGSNNHYGEPMRLSEWFKPGILATATGFSYVHSMQAPTYNIVPTPIMFGSGNKLMVEVINAGTIFLPDDGIGNPEVVLTLTAHLNKIDTGQIAG